MSSRAVNAKTNGQGLPILLVKSELRTEATIKRDVKNVVGGSEGWWRGEGWMVERPGEVGCEDAGVGAGEHTCACSAATARSS